MDHQEAHELKEGDIFYTEYDGQFHTYKLLKKEDAEETFHVLCYTPVDEEPTLESLQQLQVQFYHAPIHPETFTDTYFLINDAVTDDELIGYYEYRKQMESDFEHIASQATHYYHQGYKLTDEGKLEEAIEAYSKAIELLPTFYEALDNRAFCKMDLDKWSEAIEDFKLSLQLNPDSLLAEFSIGECYYRLGDYANAKTQFEKCIKLDPSHEISKEFLVKSTALLNHKN